MSQKSSLPQAASFVSQVLKRDILDRQRLPVSDGLHRVFSRTTLMKSNCRAGSYAPPFFLWVALLFLMGSSERWWRTGKRSPLGFLIERGTERMMRVMNFQHEVGDRELQLMHPQSSGFRLRRQSPVQ